MYSSFTRYIGEGRVEHERPTHERSCIYYIRARKARRTYFARSSFLIDKSLIVQLVSTPRSDLFSATQLWKMMGGNKSHEPSQYLRLKSTRMFILSEYPESGLSVENQGLPVTNCRSAVCIPDSICKTFRGGSVAQRGTYMEKKLLLDYAQWLSPEIKSMVLDTFIEYGQIMVEQDPNKKAKALIEKGFDAAVDLKTEGAAPEETQEEIFENIRRTYSVATRKYFTAQLEVITGRRMVDSPELRKFVAHITDRLYAHILGDSTRGLRKGLGLSKHSTPRDAMNDNYLFAISYTEKSVIKYLKKNRDSATHEGVEGVIAHAVGLQRAMLDESDEDEPVAVNHRKRKGSGFIKGEYAANRDMDQGTLEYSLDGVPLNRRLGV